MERKRVLEIKKRFENLEVNKPLSARKTTQKLSCEVVNNVYQKTSVPEFGTAQSNALVKQRVFRINSDPSDCGWNTSNGKNVIKRTPAFRSSKPDFRGGNKLKTDDQSTRILDQQVAVLPRGPPPKKPPRTFAHRVDLPQFREPPKSSAGDLSSYKSNSVSNTKPNFKRSKTEPLIMLKKIESALANHQQQAQYCGRIREVPPPPPPVNGRKTAPSRIYDVPNDNDNRRGPTYPKNEPVYSEPCVKSSPTSPAPQSSKSLYYMSTQVVDEDGNPCVGKSPTFKEALKKLQMLVQEPNSTRPEGDSDVESVKEEIKQEVVEERKIYAKRVSSLRTSTSQLRLAKSHKLMDALVLVGIDSIDGNGKVAYIKMKYPFNAEIPNDLATLVFPDANSWPPSTPIPPYVSSVANHSNYTIILTSQIGSRSYAYCRRLQPEGWSVCLPLAYAILTTRKADSFYYKILEEIENNHGLAERKFRDFLGDLYNSNFPMDSTSIRVGDALVTRSLDPRHDGHEISKLLKAVGVPNFIQLLSTMLLEKNIILVSSNISLLSDAIEGLLKSIYPFEWQFTIITVVPSSIMEFLQSPTPFIVGIMRSEKEPFDESFLQNVEPALVVDIVKGCIVANTIASSDPVIPSKLSKALSVTLYLTPVNGTDFGPSEALIRLFVQLVGHYRNFLLSECDSYPNHFRRFQKDKFIKSVSSQNVRRFLEWFTESCMFKAFIDQKLHHSSTPEGLLFEQRCADFLEESVNKKGTTLNKTVKHIGEMIKDWTS